MRLLRLHDDRLLLFFFRLEPFNRNKICWARVGELAF
jgi:hypothetical protein